MGEKAHAPKSQYKKDKKDRSSQPPPPSSVVVNSETGTQHPVNTLDVNTDAVNMDDVNSSSVIQSVSNVHNEELGNETQGTEYEITQSLYVEGQSQVETAESGNLLFPETPPTQLGEDNEFKDDSPSAEIAKKFREFSPNSSN